MPYNRSPLRRADLVTNAGVGAMFTTPERISLITAGLDHWFERESTNSKSGIDVFEYRVEEWRLQRSLGVSHFRLPPDYRPSWQFGGTEKNLELTIPALRFPCWYVCRNLRCRTLVRLPLTVSNNQMCPACHATGKRSRLGQVDFVAICPSGHLRDFPWYSWCHKTMDDPDPAPVSLPCGGKMSFKSLGGASLASQRVRCTCGAHRNLSRITFGDSTTSVLSGEMVPRQSADFLCDGQMPWNGTDDQGRVRRSNLGCGKPLVGALRTASNVYYSIVRSAIYLPRSTSKAPRELIMLLEEPMPSQMINLYMAPETNDLDGLATLLRNVIGAAADDFTDQQFKNAINVFTNRVDPDTPALPIVATDDAATAFRRAEFGVLREPQDADELRIRKADVADYGPLIQANFERIMLVDSLRETRAFVGFSRLQSSVGANGLDPRSALRYGSTEAPNDWLPAYVVHGEGIYLELDRNRVREWENRASVIDRAAQILRNYEASRSKNKTNAELGVTLTPRFLLLHALAHALLNKMTFDAGYSTAALRERIFASDDPSAPMAGLLIYTAAGDAEGTMGGLVRLGKPDMLRSTITRAIDTARWCSADPVCMEISHHGGQGPGACNLAACHGCSLVAETACEHFNRFLDRGVLIGDPEVPDLAFFSDDQSL